MKTFNNYIILALAFLLLPVVLKAQSVKYVAYFPVPYVTHMKVEAANAYFAGRDSGVVQISGNLASGSIGSSKDLILKTATTPISGNTSMSVVVGENFNNANGNFVVDNSASSLSFSNLKAQNATSNVAINTLNGDNNLQVKSIYWGTNKAFVKGLTTTNSTYTSFGDIPSNTAKLCWSPLRIKGTYEYKYYLIAYNGNTCP